MNKPDLFSSCNLCGNKRTVPAYSDKEGTTLVGCVNCGLVYHHPARYSYDWTYPEGTDNQVKYHLRKERSNELFADREMAHLEKYLGKPRQKARVLEIGCGTGSFLKALRRMGYLNTFGLEINKECAAYAREIQGLDHIYDEPLESIGFEDGFFDMLILKHVFEHVANPKVLLQEMWRILEVAGVIGITVPNYAFIQTGFGRLLGRWPLNGIVSPICHRQHLWYYTPAVAKLYLQETGFACLEICYSFAWVPFVEMTKKLRPRLGGLAEGLIMSIDRLCEVAGFWRNFTIVGQRLECAPHTL